MLYILREEETKEAKESEEDKMRMSEGRLF